MRIVYCVRREPFIRHSALILSFTCPYYKAKMSRIVGKACTKNWRGGLVGWWVGGLVGWWVGGLVGWWVGGLVGEWVGG